MMVDAVNRLPASAFATWMQCGGRQGPPRAVAETPPGWFIGFAGEREPRVAVSVVLEHGGEGGGRPAEIGAQLLASALRSAPG
ncbi:MAG: hypothetical protein R2848_16145 [Thermomicrobiales bacterium]